MQRVLGCMPSSPEFFFAQETKLRLVVQGNVNGVVKEFTLEGRHGACKCIVDGQSGFVYVRGFTQPQVADYLRSALAHIEQMYAPDAKLFSVKNSLQLQKVVALLETNKLPSRQYH